MAQTIHVASDETTTRVVRHAYDLDLEDILTISAEVTTVDGEAVGTEPAWVSLETERLGEVEGRRKGRLIVNTNVWQALSAGIERFEVEATATDGKADATKTFKFYLNIDVEDGGGDPGGGDEEPETPLAGGRELIAAEADRLSRSEGETLAVWSAFRGEDNALDVESGTATYRESGPNGYPYLELSADAALKAVWEQPTHLPVVVLLVLKDDAAAGAAERYIVDGPDADHRTSFYWNGTRWVMQGGYGARSISMTSTLLSAGWSVLRLKHEDADMGAWQDGSELASGHPSPIDHAGLVINSDYTLAAGHAELSLASVVALKDPSAADIAEWEDYFQAKYGSS